MKRSSGKMRRGFMCQSTAGSAACMAGDPRSVVMPRKLERILIDNDHHDQGLGHSVRYSRLVQSRRFHDKKIRSSASTVPVPVPVPAPTLRDVINVDHQLQLQKPRAGDSSTPDQVFQVVVMRVSLHCQGCAGKVKKHLSKMEGVTSFSVDLESKRVTVMGHVSPDGVLESVSKVKKAELWAAS